MLSLAYGLKTANRLRLYASSLLTNCGITTIQLILYGILKLFLSFVALPHLVQYSDAFYICTIISAAAGASVSTAPPERGELLPSEVRTEQTPEDVDLLNRTVAEVERYRSMDRLIPSLHNVVTIAALEVGSFIISRYGILTLLSSFSSFSVLRTSFQVTPSCFFR
jgi:hypothetical protein